MQYEWTVSAQQIATWITFRIDLVKQIHQIPEFLCEIRQFPHLARVLVIISVCFFLFISLKIGWPNLAKILGLEQPWGIAVEDGVRRQVDDCENEENGKNGVGVSS